MYRPNTRSRSRYTLANRRPADAVPPAPHPSWDYGASYLPTGASRMPLEDFWKRLGL